MRAKQRFSLIEFENRNGTMSWRVTGYRRDGSRVRENFLEVEAARCRQVELETEYLAQHTETAIRATKLTREQLQLCEVATIKLGDDWPQLLSAVDHWLKHGRQQTVAESPRLDDAAKEFKAWLETSNLRDRTRGNLKTRLSVFCNSVSNLRVADVSPEVIDAYLDKRAVSAASKDNDRRAVSKFFGWCMDRKRRWTTVNPCRAVKVDQDEKAPPTVLGLDDCKLLLASARAFKGGRLVPYVALCLFGGLRPFEASRLTWAAVNLKDNEIRLEANQTKTGRPRVVAICPTLHAWLKAYGGKEFYPANWRKDFDALKELAGFGTKTDEKPDLKPWPDDVLRHTAISHYFRDCGSYGRTAEQFGNSEAIIKAHYQGRVSSDDTKKFYALLP